MADATIEIIPVILDFDLITGQDLTFQVTYAVEGAEVSDETRNQKS